MKHVPVNRLLAICCLLVVTGLPFSCIDFSRMLEDHCCVPEKANLDKAQKAYDQAATDANAKNTAFSTAAGNVGSATTAWAAATITLVNTGNAAAFNTARDNYNDAVTVYNSALAPLRTALAAKYARQATKNAAEAALFACNLTCPTNLTCCQGDKNTDKLATLAADLASDKLTDENGIIAAISGAQTAADNAHKSLQQFNNQSCPFANATPNCVTSRFTATTLEQVARELLRDLNTEQNVIRPPLFDQSRAANTEKSRASTALALCQQTNNCQ